jgi:hypothetical protein
MPTLYRILLGPQPAPTDFRANLARCRPRRGHELLDAAIWAGISTFDSQGPAQRLARRHRIGTHLARLEVPVDDERVVLSPRGDFGHVTVWACEDLLASFVHSVAAII